MLANQPRFEIQRVSLLSLAHLSPQFYHPPRCSIMPRKAAAAATEGSAEAPEPRRSSRIKDLPKPEPPTKKPAKPRAKKADKDKQGEGEAKEDKPKSARGKKRKEAEAEEPNGEAEAEAEAEAGTEEPPAKKVGFRSVLLRDVDVPVVEGQEPVTTVGETIAEDPEAEAAAEVAATEGVVAEEPAAAQA
ncbi:hypothetical protein C0992_006259 [Termitomyces sp. T32_za158]|nr:hypothetical protein C0992_006259 [Termitomyces sp. T32_za158]